MRTAGTGGDARVGIVFFILPENESHRKVDDEPPDYLRVVPISMGISGPTIYVPDKISPPAKGWFWRHIPRDTRWHKCEVQ